MDINSLKNRITDKLSRAADWLASHSWQIALVAFLLLFALGVWVRASETSREISELKSAYSESVEQLKTLEAETVRLKNELEKKQAEIAALQQANDRKIKEVTTSAYRKAYAVSDDDLLNAYNDVISGARRRNADRGRADTSPEE